VIGGGPAGMEAAVKAGRAGCRVILVEKEDRLGGRLNLLQGTFPDREHPADILQKKKAGMAACANIEVRTGTEVISAARRGRGFECALESGGRTDQVAAGAVIVAAGFGLFDCARYGEYGYGIYPGVVTSLEFEELLRDWKEKNVKSGPGSAAFIQCVGSRDRSKGQPYCSKICCMYTARQAGMFKELFPRSRCCVFYIDIRAAGKGCEEFVRSVIEEKKVRYFRGRPGKVLPDGGRLLVRSEDTLMGVPVEVEADVVVLAPAVVPGPGAAKIAGIFGIGTDRYGFPESADGVTTASEGVFIAGGCGFAAGIREAVTQGAAAAAEAVAFVIDGGDGGRLD
jgi:heterodisulfide reductase subunit A